MRRLEALERPARVIAFPASPGQSHRPRDTRSAGWPPPPRPDSSSASSPGSFFDVRHLLSTPRGPVATQTARLTTPPQIGSGHAAVLPASLALGV